MNVLSSRLIIHVAESFAAELQVAWGGVGWGKLRDQVNEWEMGDYSEILPRY